MRIPHLKGSSQLPIRGPDWHSIKLERNAAGQEIMVCGGQRAAVAPKMRFSPEMRIADMDSLGVDVQVLSTHSALYNYHLDLNVAVATSQEANDEVAEMVKGWPERFAGLATLPMQDVGSAVKELERSVQQLDLKGAMIDDKVNGKTFDDPAYLPLFKAAEQMGALIFFHQSGDTIVNSRIAKYHLPNTVGNLADRTLTFASLVFGGGDGRLPQPEGVLLPWRRLCLLRHRQDGPGVAGALRGPNNLGQPAECVLKSLLLRLPYPQRVRLALPD